MNGDIGKVAPGGAAYASRTPESLTAPLSNEFGSMNGETMDSGHFGAGAETHDSGRSGPGVAGLPLEQLKQLLLAQLEYYFSRSALFSLFIY